MIEEELKKTRGGKKWGFNKISKFFFVLISNFSKIT
jgi:hypothetical protein